jgi:hypothetical protein
MSMLASGNVVRGGGSGDVVPGGAGIAASTPGIGGRL